MSNHLILFWTSSKAWILDLVPAPASGYSAKKSLIWSSWNLVEKFLTTVLGTRPKYLLFKPNLSLMMATKSISNAWVNFQFSWLPRNFQEWLGWPKFTLILTLLYYSHNLLTSKSKLSVMFVWMGEKIGVK